MVEHTENGDSITATAISIRWRKSGKRLSNRNWLWTNLKEKKNEKTGNRHPGNHHHFPIGILVGR